MNKFLALFKLNIKIFFGQPVGIIVGGLAPTIVMVILPYLFNGIANIGPGNVPLKVTLGQLIPGLLLLPTIMVGIVGIPITLATIKGTNLLKKIKMTNVSPILFIATFVFTFVLVILLLTVFIFTLSKIIWQSDSPNPSGAAFLIPWILLMFSTVGFGILIGNISNNSMTAFAIGVAAMLPIMFLSGIFFAEMNGWMKYFSKVIPQNHLVYMFKTAWFTDDPIVKNYSTGAGMGSLDLNLISVKIDTIIAYIYPMTIFAIQTIFLANKFKWE